MKKHSSFLTVFSIAMVAIFFLISLSSLGKDKKQKTWKVPAIASKLKNKVPASPSSILLGKKLYAQNCATCHGDKGEGDGPSSKYLGKKVADLTSKTFNSQKDGVIYYKMTKGRAPMPAYKSILKSKDRWNVVNYLRALKSKKQ